MSKKRKGDIVYSTNPDFEFEDGEEVVETLPPNKQQLRVLLDKKQRAGKKVTLVTGFIGSPTDLDILGKKLRNSCGAGGSAKNGEIIVQGDFRQRVADLLTADGYKVRIIS